MNRNRDITSRVESLYTINWIAKQNVNLNALMDISARKARPEEARFAMNWQGWVFLNLECLLSSHFDTFIHLFQQESKSRRKPLRYQGECKPESWNDYQYQEGRTEGEMCGYQCQDGQNEPETCEELPMVGPFNPSSSHFSSAWRDWWSELTW